MKEDIINYPPALSLIKVLVDLNYKVIHIGTYTDEVQKKEFETTGVSFVTTNSYRGKSNNIIKFVQQVEFRKRVEKCLNDFNVDDKDFLWLLNASTTILLGHLAKKYKTIFQYYEFTTPYVNWKYKLLSMGNDPFENIKYAYKVVQCEYNRAHIFKSYMKLTELPIVLPNKPYDNSEDVAVPNEIRDIVSELKNKINGRNVILYQGAFQGKDRRLNEYIEAVHLLSDDYVFLAMGPVSGMYHQLKDKYESDKVIFVPFIRPPYHLEVTKLCTIGIMTYVTNEKGVSGILNPLYCAPNKIFEYSKFSKPMLSNDLPGLTHLYSKYHCGVSVDYPITAVKVKDKILEIISDYENFSRGSLELYNSVDLKKIIQEILK